MRRSPETPCLELDVARAVARLRRLAGAIPGSTVHHTVEGDPHPALLASRVAAGGSFSVETPAQLRACLAAGAPEESMVHGRLVGAVEESRGDCVAAAAGLGVRRFVVDSDLDCRTVAELAPRSAVLVRVTRGSAGAVGCTPTEAVSVLVGAARLGLDAAGVSVDVGTERLNPVAWRAPVAVAGSIFTALRKAGHQPWLLGVGGGLPATHENGAPPASLFAAAIDRALRQEFGIERPQTLVELGRALGVTAAA
jgi:ornithine decarboxylase